MTGTLPEKQGKGPVWSVSQAGWEKVGIGPILTASAMPMGQISDEQGENGPLDLVMARWFFGEKGGYTSYTP